MYICAHCAHVCTCVLCACVYICVCMCGVCYTVCPCVHVLQVCAAVTCVYMVGCVHATVCRHELLYVQLCGSVCRHECVHVCLCVDMCVQTVRRLPLDMLLFLTETLWGTLCLSLHLAGPRWWSSGWCHGDPLGRAAGDKTPPPAIHLGFPLSSCWGWTVPVAVDLGRGPCHPLIPPWTLAFWGVTFRISLPGLCSLAGGGVVHSLGQAMAAGAGPRGCPATGRLCPFRRLPHLVNGTIMKQFRNGALGPLWKSANYSPGKEMQVHYDNELRGKYFLGFDQPGTLGQQVAVPELIGPAGHPLRGFKSLLKSPCFDGPPGPDKFWEVEGDPC